MLTKLTIDLLLATFTIICFCSAEDGPIDFEKPIIPPIGIAHPTIRLPPITFHTITPPKTFHTWPPITINPPILCLLFPSLKPCNPCTFGTPIEGITCGQGEGKCATLNGTCKVNQYDRAYCCPNEHQGCCPAVPIPIIIPSPTGLPPPLCLPACTTDAQCPIYQKCCGACRRCINATFT